MIARDAWLKALEEAGQPTEDDQEAVTIREFAEMFQLRREAATRRLEALVAAGKATRTTKASAVLDGAGRTRTYRVAAYRLTT